jgi:uroporphyrinogen III methyltransferase/synthase
LTYQDVASSFTVFTGHEDPAKGRRRSITKRWLRERYLVMLMGMERLDVIVPSCSRTARILTAGCPDSLGHDRPPGKTVIGDLGSIVAAADGFQPPAIAVFGHVVDLRDKLRWFEQRPLFGRRIVVTRTRKQAGALSARLRLLGADVYELPTIQVEPPENLMEFGELVRDAYQYDWLILPVRMVSTRSLKCSTGSIVTRAASET